MVQGNVCRADKDFKPSVKYYNICIDIGAMTPLLWAFHEREKIMQFYEAVSGARMHAAYFTPGGVANDLSRSDRSNINIYRKNAKKIDEIESLLTENHIFKQRTVGVGGWVKTKL